jgi:Flp pilus assembly protein TadG
VRQRFCGDDGTIMVLTIGLMVLLLALVATVTDASAVFLARRDLAGACDAAATTAAQAVDRRTLYAEAGATRLPLDPDAARDRVRTWLGEQGEAGLVVEVTGVVDDGTTVLLACTKATDPPLHALVGLPTVTVEAHASARSPLTGSASAPG